MSMIDQMIELVNEGLDPRAVVEATLSLHPGSTAKVNKSTTGKDPHSEATFAIPEGSVVTVIGIGGGDSGTDHHVQLEDGRQAIIPFMDLGESILQQEELTGAVAKVTLAKPLPQSALDFLSGEYADYGVELPENPEADSAASVTFLMKAEDEESLEMGIDHLKKLAGASFKSSAAATVLDWTSATEV